ncbi:alpha/beta-Hydrolases superfamily protein [Actinidia rufa]|uniref:Alpha/beta-Hydrolases superfamily protein n=1 Tax=Actinidia rufa TaxID=165716 RepID=A0A7J0G630_9ERIC|nr:alpha/beta-Hydrolases superfamily protein [Actinidia rufa]
MDQIQHKYVEVNGPKLHVAEIGTGPTAVVFLHGFPEIWYTWRHQMIAVANAGYRAIAPDYSGYGLSDPPPEPEKASLLDFVDDIVAILDFLNIPKVFLVGKDFGSPVANFIALLHPKRVLGVITLGVPFMPPRPPTHHNGLPEGFYISRWREPGRAEADFGRFDAKTVIRTIYILFSRSEIPIAAENQEILDMVDSSMPLPPWFTEEDLAVYGALYERSGFRTALQVPYRAMHKRLDIPDPKVEAPSLLIMGEEDYVLKFPGIEDYIKSGEVKTFVPNLETIYLPQGSHFVHEQFPDQVNQLILTFLNSHVQSI